MLMGDYGISVLRAFVRAYCPETRGAGNLGNIGHKEQIIDYLTARGYSADDVAEWMRAGNFGSSSDNSGDNGNSSEAGAEIPATTTTTAAAPAGGDNSAILAALEAVKNAVINQQAAKPAEVKIDIEAVKAAAVEAAREEYAKYNPPVVVEVRKLDGTTAKFDRVHCKTADIIKVCGAGIHCLLVGPAGSGKTTACEQVARALDLKFYPLSVGPQTTKSDLLGFIDANGNYHSTPVRDAFQNGGLLLLDEVDAANAGVLTVLNALLANGHCSFPDGIITKHDNFRCIAAANTYGRGADRLYVGRNQLDAATLDRFSGGVVNFDYDETLEMSLAGNDTWCAFVQSLRHAAERLKERVVLSPRASIAGAKLLKLGYTWSAAAEMAIFKGISDDLKSKLKSEAAAEFRTWCECHGENAEVAAD